ncbi:MAG: hypothetical protein K9G67_06385 [Bacteroidales bacterium]|nr:hypothetical protein [Bacteroidales bacterium]MCF8344718.1 hypothetical protein [Bacteroidales bacterium]MCF8350331.1 hypothetical protein [Bacteroidales bacterium]MCF8375965.1 hypothetical protein [Bacteroidales bacterium]MCF8400453.1 hypothetical protein [Bacteroidales bacterium]
MSSQYSNTERLIASALSSFPGTKQRIKRLYQKLSYLFHKNNHSFHSEYELKEYSYKNHETFFGYYDRSPLNAIGKYLLFHATEHSTLKPPDPEKEIEIVLSDFESGEISSAFTTKAYNWQQGSRAMWLDNERFIFNDYDTNNDVYISKIGNAVAGKIVKPVGFPVYDCHRNKAVSLNFDRLHLLRPDYGYANRKEKINTGALDDNNDGIFLIDLESGEHQLIISLEHLKSIQRIPEFKKSLHKVNHLMYSPDGNAFMFLHRWINRGVRNDRLFVADASGKDIQLLAEGMVSHCAWDGSDRIIGYFSNEKRSGWHRIDLKQERPVVSEIPSMRSFRDGHPNIHYNRMIFDSYPDKSRMKHLYLADLRKGSIKEIGSFFEGLKFYGQTRCDLHPRWDLNGEYMFVDSVHKGKRQLYSILYRHE